MPTFCLWSHTSSLCHLAWLGIIQSAYGFLLISIFVWCVEKHLILGKWNYEKLLLTQLYLLSLLCSMNKDKRILVLASHNKNHTNTSSKYLFTGLSTKGTLLAVDALPPELPYFFCERFRELQTWWMSCRQESTDINFIIVCIHIWTSMSYNDLHSTSLHNMIFGYTLRPETHKSCLKELFS